MTELQLDMFEVQLGAAILVQFRTAGGVVRVLADAGVTGYPKDHVHKKLGDAFIAFEPGTDRRIDLIIGTHYDADHLDGLVPIINDRSISIGETWLPPVANDAQPHPADEPVSDARLLALQFVGKGGDVILDEYLRAKARACETLAQAEQFADEYRDPQHRVERKFERSDMFWANEGAPTRRYFEAHIEGARYTLGETDDDHAADPVVEPPEIDRVDLLYYRDGVWPLEALDRHWRGRPELADRGARALAYIRESTARDAITAGSLHAVVKALEARNLAIRCAVIDDATPRRFVWDGRDKRFRPSAQGASDGPELILLGPSKGLIKKHWDRLPIGAYAIEALQYVLPIKHVTPSNQLSYVVKLSWSGQNVLISGDTGFVDFRPNRSRDFYPSMLTALDDLHIVQVAHHGGANAYFYGALLAAPFARQAAHAFLLLSHAVDDKHRPSDEFARFMEQLDRPTPWIELLFTSRPQEKFVRDFKRAFAPVMPGPPAACGDARLIFVDGAWKIQRHAIAAP